MLLSGKRGKVSEEVPNVVNCLMRINYASSIPCNFFHLNMLNIDPAFFFGTFFGVIVMLVLLLVFNMFSKH